MAAIPFMPLYVSDYLADTPHLSAVEHGAYFLLIMTYWQRQKPLPADDKKLARIARLTPDEWEAIKDEVLELFTLEDGFYRHKRIDEEMQKAADLIEKKKRGGKASAKRRAKTPTTQDEDTSNTCSTPVATPAPTESQQSGNHKEEDTDTDSSVPNGTGGKPPPIDWKKRLWENIDRICAEHGRERKPLGSLVGKAVSLAGGDRQAVCLAVEDALADWPMDFDSWLMARFKPEKTTGVRRGGERGWLIPPGTEEFAAWESSCRRTNDERALWKFRTGLDVETPTRWPGPDGWNAKRDYTPMEAAE